MKIEKYYYSENKSYWDSILERAEEKFEALAQALQELPEEDRKMVEDEQMKAITERLSQLLPLPDEVCMIVNPLKYNRFLKLAHASIAFAEETITNLLVCTEGLTGCISFVAEELTCFAEQRAIFGEFNAAADEIHIAPSVDTGEGSSTDIDGGVRIEFWFDFTGICRLKSGC